MSEGMSSTGASHRQPESCERNTLPSSFCPSPRQGRPHGRLILTLLSMSPCLTAPNPSLSQTHLQRSPTNRVQHRRKKNRPHPHEPTTSPILPHRHASAKHQAEHETMPPHPTNIFGKWREKTAQRDHSQIIPQNKTTRPPNPPPSTSADTDTETTIAPSTIPPSTIAKSKHPCANHLFWN